MLTRTAKLRVKVAMTTSVADTRPARESQVLLLHVRAAMVMCRLKCETSIPVAFATLIFRFLRTIMPNIAVVDVIFLVNKVG